MLFFVTQEIRKTTILLLLRVGNWKVGQTRLLTIVIYHEIYRISSEVITRNCTHTHVYTHAHKHWLCDVAVSLLKRVATRRNVL